MENSQIKSDWTRAFKYACRRGYRQLADDFAQEAVIAWNRGRKASPRELFIDFLRKEYGSTRSRVGVKHPTKSPRGSKFESFDQPRHSGRTLHDIVHAAEGDSRPLGDLGRGRISWGDIRPLTPRQEKVLALCIAGSTQADIARALGITQARVSQILRHEIPRKTSELNPWVKKTTSWEKRRVKGAATHSLHEVERLHILRVLLMKSGNRLQTADALGISVRCLRMKLRQFGVQPAEPGKSARRNMELVS